MINTIICEFNPFHNGHKYLIDTARQKTGADATVCIMSGNFVQRGEPALWDKHTRAEAAVKNGADLVIALPTAHSLAGAQVFAMSGVYLASALGVEASLCFGTESDDITELYRLALADTKKLDEGFRRAIDGGHSYAAAAQLAYEYCGLDASMLRTPNNLLAFEYIKAVIAQKSDLKVVPIQRIGTDHDSTQPSGEFASATYIRQNLGKDVDKYANDLTPPRLDRAKMDELILFELYNKTPEMLARYADVSEGLEHRIHQAASDSRTLNEFLDKVKSKRYTHARLRRTALNIFLQIPKGMHRKMPPCIQVLAFNDRGRALIKELYNTCRLPIIIKPSDYEKLASSHFDIERRATDLYEFCTFIPNGAGQEYKRSPRYIK